MKELRRLVHPFPPVIAPECRVLILGSAPSVRSVELGFYYMHPQNRFWKTVGALLGAPGLFLAPKQEKIRLLLENRIALYDAVYACDIAGSADLSAKNIVPADIPALIAGTGITRIFTNGALAYQTLLCFYPQLKPSVTPLPSTSPANARWTDTKLLEAWKVILSDSFTLSLDTENS